MESSPLCTRRRQGVKTERTKAQSAIEYLTTYGWAIIILSIVLAAMFALGAFNPNTFVSTTCVFPAEFGCVSATLAAATGQLIVNIQQSTASTINVTAIGCNNSGSPTNMEAFTGSSQIPIPIGSNYTFTGVYCYSNGTTYTSTPGQVFKGYIIINYTSITTSFPHTVEGTLIAKTS